MVSFSHCVASPGKYVAIASTTVETNDPLSELKPAFDLLGPVMQRYVTVQLYHILSNSTYTWYYCFVL